MEAEHQHEKTLLDLPIEIWYSYILPLLVYGDLLRLRRVCKLIKIFSEEFIRNNFNSQEREINETDATFVDFISRNLPTSSLYINNSGPDIYEDPNVPEFLELYGNLITHLRVRHFSTCFSDAELRFFSQLLNLQHLELEFTDATNISGLKIYKASIEGQQRYRKIVAFPPNFKNLKTLKFNKIQVGDILRTKYVDDVIDFCTKLEYYKHPQYINKVGEVIKVTMNSFTSVMISINRRRDQSSELSNLKYYDVEHILLDDSNRFPYYRLFPFCHDNAVELLNVQGSNLLFLSEPPPIMNHTKHFGTTLISLNNCHSLILMGELPNLVRFVVKTTNNVFQDMWSFFGNQQPQWPSLTILDITIDSEQLTRNLGMVQELLHFLFELNQRTKLRELFIRFGETTDIGVNNNFPVPRVQNIIQSCGNITKLTLSNWIGTNIEMSLLWDGLLLLEDVEFDKCKQLGMVALMGRQDRPFFKLTKLKKVTLKGLHLMPRITDAVFRIVFRHLKIKQFILQSEEPLSSFTVAGIERLLTGDFNTYVEKFPFQGWSLEGVSQEQFAHLKSQFRASYTL